MTTNLATVDTKQFQVMERVVIEGDLAALNPKERVLYYRQVCDSVGLNPLTKPFEYIRLNSKLTLYAKRDATDQLRKIHGVSVKIVAREKIDDLYIVTAQATDKTGRADESVGAVNLAGLKGEAAANAIMKCETKAKRRVTLSICGLGMLDETEVGSVPGAVSVPIDTTTGEIIGAVEQAPEPAITDEQIADLKAKAEEVGADMEKFLEWLGIDRLEAMPASLYSRAIKALENKAKRGAK